MNAIFDLKILALRRRLPVVSGCTPPERGRESRLRSPRSLSGGMGWPVPLVILALAVGPIGAQDYGTEKPAPVPVVATPLTAAEKAALAAVDVRIGAVESLGAKIEDADYQASVIASIADMKKRREALAKNFDAGLYEALMHSVISRYQVVTLWLTPPRVLPRGTKPVATPAAPAPLAPVTGVQEKTKAGSAGNVLGSTRSTVP